MQATFRALAEADLPMLHAWLGRPHVRAWWAPARTLEEVREHYGPRIVPEGVRPLDAPAGLAQYLALEGGHPFGFVQAYRVMAHQDEGWWPEETDPHALGVDAFIGVPGRLGGGSGARMVRAFVDFLFADPRVTTLQADPDPANVRAVACFRKVGFRDVGTVGTPDGTALLMRLGRPG